MMRNFLNKLPDFVPGNLVDINKNKWLTVCNEIVGNIRRCMPPSLDNCDGGLYVGNAGVSYMFYKLAQNPLFSKEAPSYTSLAHDYIAPCISYITSKHCRDPGPSFLLGPAGVYFVYCALTNHGGDIKKKDEFASQYARYFSECVKMNFMKNGSDELFVGRAGYLCGVFNLKKMGCSVLDDEKIRTLCKIMIQSGRSYSQQRRLKVPLMYAYYGTEYLGAAHGLSSILQMLLRFSSYLDEGEMADVRQSVDFFLTIEQKNHNYAPAMDEVASGRPEDHELIHWCHGAPGVVYMFAQAYKVWGDVRYLDACHRCAELTWEKGLLKKGPGICHGIAGSGYVFLLLYRLTGDLKYLHRAEKFAEFLLTDEFRHGARTPDCPYSLYEGWAGTVCFLSDLTQPHLAEFPFFDVF